MLVATGRRGIYGVDTLLAYITGSVDHELLLRDEYRAIENRILRAKLNRRLQFSDAERRRSAKLASDEAVGY